MSLDYEKLQRQHEERMKPLILIANPWVGVILFGCISVPGVLLWALWRLTRAAP